MKEWLTEEEQYSEHLNIDEIMRIEDEKLREIRTRHWNNRKKIFLDERMISDRELGRLWEEDKKLELKEIEDYKDSLQ